jgi:hypothetical protein
MKFRSRSALCKPEPDDDGEPVTSMVVDWQPNTPGGNPANRPVHGPKPGDKISVPRCCG